MKRVIILATLLMVGCGSRQQQSDNNDAATEIAKPKKVSVMGEEKSLPELRMVKPEGEPIRIDVVTADKDAEYIKQKGIKLKDVK